MHQIISTHVRMSVVATHSYQDQKSVGARAVEKSHTVVAHVCAQITPHTHTVRMFMNGGICMAMYAYVYMIYATIANATN